MSLARERTGADAYPPWHGPIGLALRSRWDFVYDQAGGRLLLDPRTG